MSLTRAHLAVICSAIALAGLSAEAQADDDANYTGIAAAKYSAGPPKGISFSGSVMWQPGAPAINWVTGWIIDGNGNRVGDLGSLDHTFEGSTRTTTVEDTVVTAGPGTYRIRLFWYHNEGGELKKTTDSNLVTVPADDDGGP